MGNILILGLFWQLTAQPDSPSGPFNLVLGGEEERHPSRSPLNAPEVTVSLARPIVTSSSGRKSLPTATGLITQALEILMPRRGRQLTPQASVLF